MRSGSTHTASSRVTTSFIGIEPVGVQSTSIVFQSVVKQLACLAVSMVRERYGTCCVALMTAHPGIAGRR